MIPEQISPVATRVPRFAERVLAASPRADTPERIETLMLNIGLRCVASCAHCHHSCTPNRTEVMSRDTMLDAVRLAELLRPELVDITGGEPEEFAHLPELIERLRDAGITTRVRTNLVALARPENAALTELFAARGVRVLASLPGTSAAAIDAQRGSAWWETASEVLRRLNELGYGRGSEGGSARGYGCGSERGSARGSGCGGLILDLAYNPPTGELSRPQIELETEFRVALEPLGVRFDSLLAINNVPVGRMRTRMQADDTYHDYLQHLSDAFNPAVVDATACRHGLEIAWDGSLWDCDFNLAAGTRVAAGPLTVTELLAASERGAADLDAALAARRIGFGPHCYACTAAEGSS